MGKKVAIHKVRSIDSFGYVIAVCNANNGKVIKSFGDDTDNELAIANKFCQDNGYTIVNNFTSIIPTVNKIPNTEKTITIDQLLEAYKEYALEQIRGGCADIDMLDRFFNDYLNIDITEAYETALEIDRKECGE